MKTFEEICRMTQSGVKEYMQAYLSSNKYSPINGKGYLYAKGTIPVLLVAHMDTVHKELCKEINKKDGKISSPQGIGGDDRCGIFMIMNIVKELHCSVLLTEDEETGGHGARAFANTKYVKNLDVNYMIEFDRKGSNDCVYYTCDNRDFKEFVGDATGFKEAQGSYTDICSIMPVAMIAGVNLSCGYYNPHTKTEYVIYDEMIDNIDQAKALIKTECDKPFKYIAKQYSFSGFSKSTSQISLFDKDYGKKSRSPFSYEPHDDTELELEVIFKEDILDETEECDVVYGMTKAECWFRFFMAHPEVCMDNVVDYSYT